MTMIVSGMKCLNWKRNEQENKTNSSQHKTLIAINSDMSRSGTARIENRVKQKIKDGEFYEAHQMYRTIFSRQKWVAKIKSFYGNKKGKINIWPMHCALCTMAPLNCSMRARAVRLGICAFCTVAGWTRWRMLRSTPNWRQHFTSSRNECTCSPCNICTWISPSGISLKRFATGLPASTNPNLTAPHHLERRSTGQSLWQSSFAWDDRRELLDVDQRALRFTANGAANYVLCIGAQSFYLCPKWNAPCRVACRGWRLCQEMCLTSFQLTMLYDEGREGVYVCMLTVFQLLCDNCSDEAKCFYQTFTKKHPKLSSSFPYEEPLLNLAHFLFEALETANQDTFLVLYQHYSVSGWVKRRY